MALIEAIVTQLVMTVRWSMRVSLPILAVDAEEGVGMSLADDLFEVIAEFEKIASYGESDEYKKPVKQRISVLEDVGKAHSGSWLGYHARVYQKDFKPVLGASFDRTWGFGDRMLGETRGEWLEYDPDGLKRHILQASNDAAFVSIKAKAKEYKVKYEESKAAALSIMATYLSSHDDEYLKKISETVENLGYVSAAEFVQYYAPKQVQSADRVALNEGVTTPIHVTIACELSALSSIFNATPKMIQQLKQAASHMERKLKSAKKQERVGTNVFIGHGRSLLWRELKDFVKDRLGLPFDEFNRVPVAGVTNTARLIEMLDAAAIAFLVMTAEDETNEGKMQARMNVIHEVGLFQGRLGFTKAIIMLEDGCEEFSNVQGLGQIRFPKGNIKAAFEEVREVLEREGLVEQG
ncbi:TIR domain-containing protein [Sphingobium lactosutens]|nr:TIR domain-containing protein [Sphingobium lactosutens]